MWLIRNQLKVRRWTFQVFLLFSHAKKRVTLESQHHLKIIYCVLYTLFETVDHLGPIIKPLAAAKTVNIAKNDLICQRQTQQHLAFRWKSHDQKSSCTWGTKAVQSDPLQKHLSSRADGIIIPFLEKCSRYVPSGELFTHFVECELKHDWARHRLTASTVVNFQTCRPASTP